MHQTASRVLLPAIFLLGLGAGLPAQLQTLPFATSGGFNQGNVGGGFYCNLTVLAPTTLLQLDYVASAISPAGSSSVRIYLGPSTHVGNETTPGLWTLAGTTAAVAIPGGAATPVAGLILGAGPNPGPGIALPPGTYGVALEAVGHSWRYVNGATSYTSPTLTATFGAASSAFLAGTVNSPRTLVGSLSFVSAAATPFVWSYGSGCYDLRRSFYEYFPTGSSFDLAFRSMRLAFDPVGNRYSAITGGTSPIVAPTTPTLGLGASPTLAIPLGPPANPQPILFPGATAPASVTTVTMAANLYLDLLGAALPTPVPSVQSWLGAPVVRIGCERPVQAAAGTTHYEFDATTGSHLFTWLGVPDQANPQGLNSFQLAFFGNGDVEFRWGAMSTLSGATGATLVGFATGNGALDPGLVDLSTRLLQTPALSTASLDRPALALSASAPPAIGTTTNLVCSNATGLSAGIVVLGLAGLAGLDLAILGAPGCSAFVDTAPMVSTAIGNVPGLAMQVPVTIPPLPALIGTSLYAQAYWLDPLQQNPFLPTHGLLSSNGLWLRIG